MELLFSVTKKDLRIDAFYAGGPGGQNQNKRKTGCRITHIASGAVAEGRDQRTFEQNKKNAFLRMTETQKFKDWLNIQCCKHYEYDKALIEIDDIQETIRTYNFPRQTVKDHRTGKKYNLKRFMDGERAEGLPEV